MCRVLNQTKKCLDSYKITLGHTLTIEQCQDMCEDMAYSGREGCCEYDTDQEGTCKWQHQMQLQDSDEHGYGALCTTRNGICLLIL